MVAGLIRVVLAEAGIEVTHATDAERAWELAHEQKFDLILLDGSGFELCRRLQQDETLKHIPVVFMSGRTDIEYQRAAFDIGAVDFIPKPCDIEQFAARILAHLKRRRPQ